MSPVIQRVDTPGDGVVIEFSPTYGVKTTSVVREGHRIEFRSYTQNYPLCVYFVKPSDRDRIKIGVSEHIWQRFRAIEHASGVDLDVLGIIPGGEGVEKAMHARFKSARIPRMKEWFRASAELLTFIRDHAETARKLPAYCGLPLDRMPDDGSLTDLGEVGRILGQRRDYVMTMAEASGITLYRHHVGLHVETDKIDALRRKFRDYQLKSAWFVHRSKVETRKQPARKKRCQRAESNYDPFPDRIGNY